MINKYSGGNMENTNPQLKNTEKPHLVVGWILLTGLFVLRIPFLTGVAILGNQLWLDPFFQIGTYLLTAILIYWERHRLAIFHIDRLALSIIILFKPIQTIILSVWKIENAALAFPKWSSLIIWIISIGLIIALCRSRASLPKFTMKSFYWLLIGLIVGFFTVLLLAYPASLQWGQTITLNAERLSSILKAIPRDAVYQMGYAAVSEEPFFRGFLWGFLAQARWREKWIWLFQALLFVIGHLYNLPKYPVSFWVIVPVCGLVLGGLVWRSKTISSSMAAHAIINTLLKISGSIVASLK